MKITYYNFNEYFNSRYDSVRFSKQYEGCHEKNYASFDLAVNSLLNVYNWLEPYSIQPNNSINISEPKIYEKVHVSEKIPYTVRGKEKFRTEIVETFQLKVDYTPYCYVKSDFSRVNDYNTRAHSKAQGYYLVKIGDVTRLIDKEKLTINWSAPVYIKFFSADFIQTNEVKEVGKPYAPATNEIKNEKEISDWLPVTWYKGHSPYRESEFHLGGDREAFCLKETIYVTKQELEIIE